MIILLGSQKGGCGKSTTAINICAHLALNESDVVLVDADRQCTASNWVADRSQLNVPTVHCVQKYGNVSATLTDLDQRYEYVVVDAAARDSRELRTAMVVADLLIMPFRPSQADLDTLTHMNEVVEEAKDLNPSLEVRALLTMASANPFVTEVQEATEYLDDYPDIRLFETVVRDRKVFRDALSEGLGVVETDNVKAKNEMTQLMEELM